MKKLVPVNFDHNFYDEKIDVFEFTDGKTPDIKYLIKDFREHIRFAFSGKLDLDVCDNETFNDNYFYEKVAKQNADGFEPMERNDSYYRDRLYREVNRIIDHCESTYMEFGAKPDPNMIVYNSNDYKIKKLPSLRTSTDPIYYNGKLINKDDLNFIE